MGSRASKRRPAVHQAWIDILRLEEASAKERGSKTQNSLRKARWAIENTDEEFTEADQLRKLKGIGSVTIKLLEKRILQADVATQSDGAAGTLKTEKGPKKRKMKKERSLSPFAEAQAVSKSKSSKKSKPKAKVDIRDDPVVGTGTSGDVDDADAAFWAAVGPFDDLVELDIEGHHCRTEAEKALPVKPVKLGPAKAHHGVEVVVSRFTHPARRPSDSSAIRHPLDVHPDPPLENTSHPDCKLWKQGTFRIVLLVDHRERIFGLGKAKVGAESSAAGMYEDEEYAQADLKDKEPLSNLVGMFVGADVEVDRKALPAGDFVWVARRDGEEDVMLDTIVERKREDDLFHSVKDSRLMGQKLRMTASGARHLVCIIEKWNKLSKSNREGYMAAGLKTTRMRLQVHQEFLLHESDGPEDTVAWLTLRHRVMRDIFEAQDLHVIPADAITRQNYLPLLSSLSCSDKQYCIPYSSFLSLNAPHALRQRFTTFGRMLLAMNGVTPERALDLVKRFGTPRALWDTCRQVQEEALAMQNEASETVGKLNKRKKVKAEKLLLDRIEEGSVVKGVRAMGETRAKAILDLWYASSSC